MIKIDLQLFKIIPKLKSTRLDSAYIDTIMIWEEENNPDIETVVRLRNVNDIFRTITSNIKISDEFIKENKLEKYHIELLRKLYFESDILNSMNYYLSIGYKRPYGNSDVIYDIFEEYNKVVNISSDYDKQYDFINNNKDLLLDIHDKVMDTVDILFSNFSYDSLESTEYVSSRFSTYEPTENGIKEMKFLLRNKKINRLI